MFDDQRLITVLGKGGVGRTTLVAALGLALAKRGRRVHVLEFYGGHELGRRLGLTEVSYEPTLVRPNLWHRTLSPEQCIADFAGRKLGGSGLLRRLLSAAPTRAFLEAVPGLPDLVQLGKVENLLNEPLAGELVADVVVVDGPATGHGLTLVGAPRAMREMARSGPFADLATLIESLLHGTEACVLPVSLLEEVPVQETTELVQQLRSMDLPLRALVANRALPPWTPDALAWPQVRRALQQAPTTEALLALAEQEDTRQAEQQLRVARLGDLIQGPLLTLPELEEGADAPDALQHLADHLTAQLARPC